MTLCNPVHSNPLGQLEQCGGGPGGKDTEQGGPLKNWRILSCKYPAKQRNGINPVGLTPKVFISSAYNNSEACVLRKRLTTFTCPVLSRVSLCGMALP